MAGDEPRRLPQPSVCAQRQIVYPKQVGHSASEHFGKSQALKPRSNTPLLSKVMNEGSAVQKRK